MSDDQRVKLGSFTPTIHRDCWITLWHCRELNIDIVVGAGTKEACAKAFEHLAERICVDELVYAATVVATKDGMQPFRALLSKPIECTCMVGLSDPTEVCDLHGGRRHV